MNISLFGQKKAAAGVPIITFGLQKKAESAPSLKPPKEWFEKKAAEVKTGNPGYSDEQVSATVGKIWYHEMGRGQRKARREKEGKKYGKAPEAHKSISAFSFSLQKGHSYQAVDADQVKRSPVVVVDYFEDGKFVEQLVCTAPMVLEDPENYDTRTFTILIKALAEDWYYADDDCIKKCEMMVSLADALKKRLKAEVDARKEMAKKMKESGATTDVKVESNWDKRKKYFYGKSLLWLSD